jgi:hypothetical protein
MRFHGTVGFATSVETVPGVWNEQITERPYYGTVTRNFRRLGPPPQVPPLTNPTLSLENSISIVGDANAYENYEHIRYVRWNGVPWEVTSVEVQRPRLNLSIGGLWNGNTP